MTTKELAESVLEQQERLVSLVALHHDELDAISRTLPDLKRETLDNMNARLAEVVAELRQAGAAATKSVNEAYTDKIAALVAQSQATRDEITALQAKNEQWRAESLPALARSLSGIAEKHARAMLASDENKETIRAAFDEHSKPILAALESKGGSFIDLYQGEFIAGKSDAKRGQIWTYFGNTLLCTKDTDQAPQYYDTSETWALLAAKGAGGAAGTGGTGGGIDEAPIDGTPYSRQDAGWVAAGVGAGDVVGPASAEDDNIATFDLTTGKLIQDGGKTIAEVEASAVSTVATATQTLTNKRITARIATLTDAATVTPATDSYDGGILATLSQTTDFINPTGTPTDFQRYTLRIKSTSARALTWTNGGSGTKYRGSADLALPASTSGASLTDYLVFMWNAADSKWDLVGRTFGF